MPFLASIEAIPDPGIEVSGTKRSHRSPDGKWIAEYHDPFEFRMGVHGWKLSVLRAEDQRAIERSPFEQLSDQDGLICPQNMRPWRHDSQVLAILTWSRGLYLFDVVRASFLRVRSSYWNAKWAPNGPRLLTYGGGQYVSLLDGDGRLLRLIDWAPDRAVDCDLSAADWLRSGRFFFVLGRPSKQASSRITFFNQDDGKAVVSYRLDPLEVLPYDSERFKAVSRGSWSLICDGRRIQGALLDRWSAAHFDLEHDVLRLSVFRPVGDPYLLDGQLTCRAKEEWVAVKMAEG